jgi:integrase
MQEQETEVKARFFGHLSGGRDGKKYELASKTLRTWRRYHTAQGTCQEVADELGLALYPVDPDTGKPAKVDHETLMAVFEHIIEERDGAVGSIHVAKQALSLAYRLRGHPPPEWWRLREFLQGVKREKGGPRRQARALLGADLDAIVARLDPASARGARNGCLLELTWHGALRSDEAVTLAWDARGLHGKGFLTTSPRGIEIHLDRAKTAQDGEGQHVTIPAVDAPAAIAWLDHWVRAAGRQPGRLVFSQISRSDRILWKPMSPTAVTHVVREHVLDYLLAGGMEEVAAVTAANGFRSHSCRSGYATTAAYSGVAPARIQQHCRHKSPITTAGYVRRAEEWDNSGLKGLLR